VVPETVDRPVVYEHFTSYADEPNRVYGLSGEGVLARLDSAFSYAPVTTGRITDDLSGLSVDSTYDEYTISGVAGSNATTPVLAIWVSPIFMPHDGDEFRIQDVTLDYLYYSSQNPIDYLGPHPTPTDPSRGIDVRVFPSPYLIGNRGNYFPSSDTAISKTGITYQLPQLRSKPRPGDLPTASVFWRDQRMFTERLVADALDGDLTLNMNLHAFQVGVEMQLFDPNGATQGLTGTRVYGMRIGIDGPTITPGYDK
jgi:hypothetical protein